MKDGSGLHLGEKLRLIRNAKGISQENMAYAIKSNPTFISRLERGYGECEAEILRTIRHFLEIENSPLLDHELEIYENRINVWEDLITAGRITDARAMQSELSPILGLPFQEELSLRYMMLEVRLLIGETHFLTAKEKFKNAEKLMGNASKDNLFRYHRNKGYLYPDGDKNALKHYLQALELIGVDKPDAGLLYCIGRQYFIMGKIHYAMRYLERAKAASIGDQNHLISLSIASLIIMCYKYTGECKEAKRQIDAVIARSLSINNDVLAGLLIMEKGIISNLEGNLNEALEFNNQAYTYLQDKHESYVFSILANKADYLARMKKIDEYHNTLKLAKPLAKDNELYTILLDSIDHKINLNDSSSINYIENIAIPMLKTGNGNLDYKFGALQLCRCLEAHYRKKNAKTKAMAICCIIKEIYEYMFTGDVEFE